MSLVLSRVSAATKGIIPPPTELIAEMADAQTRHHGATFLQRRGARHPVGGAPVGALAATGRARPLPDYFEIIERVSA